MTNPMTLGTTEGIGRYGVNTIGWEELAAVSAVLESKRLFRYDSNEESVSSKFESEIAGFFNASWALTVCNGTAALKCALVGAKLNPGDEALVTPYTFIATVNAIIAVGAVPVFVDVDETFSVSLKDANRKISPRTRAMVIAHIQGDGSDSIAAREFCNRNGLALIEDSAQAMGASVHGTPVGSIGHFGCFSLQSNKIIGSGEGGFLICNDQDQYITARNYHDQGAFRDNNDFGSWDNPLAIIGENLKATELQSAVALVQFKKLPHLVDMLRARRQAFLESLDLAGRAFRLRQVLELEGNNGTATAFIANTPEACKSAVAALSERNVPVTKLYSKLVYEEGVLRRPGADRFWKTSSGDCERAADYARRVFWVLHSILATEDEHARVGAVVSEVAAQYE